MEKPIFRNPSENIGLKALNYGGMPIEDILYKLEETDMYNDDYAKQLDNTDIGVDNYMRDVLSDRFRTEPLMNADEEPTRNYVEQSGILNTRFNTHRGNEAYPPQHSEMFMGFMDYNKNGADYEHPRYDTCTARNHTVARARNTNMDFHDSNVDHVAESDWQPAQVSYAKKDMLTWVQNIYNEWHLPSFINFSVNHVAENKVNEDLIKKSMLDEHKNYIDETGPEVRDQYGRTLHNHIGYNWYMLPNVKHTTPYQLESTTQPRAVIPENDPTSKGLWYSDAVFHSDAITSRIPHDQVRFPDTQYSRVADDTTHKYQDSTTTKLSKTLEPFNGGTRIKYTIDQTGKHGNNDTTRQYKNVQQSSDVTKQNFNTIGKFYDPVFGLNTIKPNMYMSENDSKNILNRTENTTVNKIETYANNTGGHRVTAKHIPDKKFGYQENSQGQPDQIITRNKHASSLKTLQSNFDNKEFATMRDELEVHTSNKRGMDNPRSTLTVTEATQRLPESHNSVQRASSTQDTWASLSRTNMYTETEEFRGDNSVHHRGGSARYHDPYGHARNNNKHGIDLHESY